MLLGMGHSHSPPGQHHLQAMLQVLFSDVPAGHSTLQEELTKFINPQLGLLSD
jgi:hypothetical protein